MNFSQSSLFFAPLPNLQFCINSRIYLYTVPTFVFWSSLFDLGSLHTKIAKN
jgi:hypothetical protein